MKGAFLAALAGVGILLTTPAASAASSPAETGGRVAILGPADSALVSRLQRNFADKPALLVSAALTTCSRTIVAKQLYDLDADTAICTDGDVATVWRRDDGSVQLIDAVPILHTDDRTIELVAARVTITARSGKSSAPTNTVLVVNGDADAEVPVPLAPTPTVDRPMPIARLPAERLAPSVTFAAGPMLLASKAGSSFAMSAEAQIGVGRAITFIPWIATIPVPRAVETSNGSASYRPTLFGLGFGLPLRSWKKTVVPRLGAGYALIWMRTWPERAKAPGTALGDSEDLWAPAMYATAALSIGLTDHVRVAAEGLLGVATHNLVVRIAREKTDSWGIPLGSLGARVELVLP